MNHSNDKPNVAYVRDKNVSSLNFMTTSLIQPGDELCIYHGKNLWFQADCNGRSENDQRPDSSTEPSEIDGFALFPENGLESVSEVNASFPRSANETQSRKPPTTTDNRNLATPSPPQDSASQAILKEDLPFDKLKFPDELEPETEDGPMPTSASGIQRVSSL